MLLNYSKSLEKELKIYGWIIDVLTLFIFHTWVNRKFFKYRDNYIIRNLTRHPQLVLHESTIKQIENNDVDKSNIEFRYTWDPNLKIVISLDIVHGHVFIFEKGKPELWFSKEHSDEALNSFTYYVNQYDILKRKLLHDIEQNKKHTSNFIRYNYILVP